MNLLRDLILLVLLLFLSVSLKMNSRRHWKALPLTPASSENRAQKQVHSRKSCAKILDLLTYCMIHTQTYSPTKNRTETKLSLFQIFFLLWKFQEFMMELFRWVNLHFRPPAFFSKWFISFREIIIHTVFENNVWKVACFARLNIEENDPNQKFDFCHGSKVGFSSGSRIG